MAWVLRALGSTVVVDWHNLAFTIMEQTLRKEHPFIAPAKLYERAFSSAGDAHLCVTAAMQAWLRAQWGVEARVLHDRPPSFFRPLPPQERHELLRRLRPQLVDAHGAPLWPAEGEAEAEGAPWSPWAEGGTPWTTVGSGGRAVARAGAPALLVSSTSWTADEDFGLLLAALKLLDEAIEQQEGAAEAAGAEGAAAAEAEGAEGAERAAAGGGALRVVAVITGKGPLKAHYEERIRLSPMRHVAVLTMWLEPEDYPRLLGAASLGVCLHTSSSGLDLPMKVLDMLGCGLPVCAVGFPALPELVTHGTNGLVFSSAPELAAQLTSLLARGAAPTAALQRLREAVTASEAGQPRWAENWRPIAPTPTPTLPPTLPPTLTLTLTLTLTPTRQAVAAPLMERAPPSARLSALRALPLLLLGYAARGALAALYRAS